jgi:hypothetical protein
VILKRISVPELHSLSLMLQGSNGLLSTFSLSHFRILLSNSGRTAHNAGQTLNYRGQRLEPIGRCLARENDKFKRRLYIVLYWKCGSYAFASDMFPVHLTDLMGRISLCYTDDLS